MKTKILIAIVSLSGFLVSCSSSWLDTKPTKDYTPEIIFATTENAYTAIQGLNNLTTWQYLSRQGMNGEGYMKLQMGEYTGEDCVFDLPGWGPIINHSWFTNPTTAYAVYAWYYYYKLIADANTIVGNVDAAEGPDSDKKEIKARALTYRAYSYFMLSQVYSYRWMDSNNGSTDGIILRLDTNIGEDNMGLSTLAETYTQIYADLDDAIALFKESTKPKPKFYQMSIDAAYAIYARAALTREDFKKAEEMAVLARGNNPLMDNSAYMSGFYDATSEWIWGSYGESDNNIFFFAHGSYFGYNAVASMATNYPAAITKELYTQIPRTDIRKELFLEPEDPTWGVHHGVTKALDNKYKEKFPLTPSNRRLLSYQQFKMGVSSQPGVANLPHFRSSEMYLIEAEAILRQKDGRDAKAQSLMKELIVDTARDPKFTTTKTGDALLNEVYLYRKIELWGEGFSWYDMKRRGAAIKRTAHTADYLGGSYDLSLAITIEAQENNKWTWSIPESETDYNEALKNAPLP